MSGTDGLIFEGKDLDEALSRASDATGIPKGSLEYELLEEGRRGVFGLGARSVRVRLASSPAAGPDRAAFERALARAEALDDPEADAEPGPAAPEPSSDVPPGLDATVRRMIRLIGLDLGVQVAAREGACTVTLDGRDRKTLAARDGELLDALEFVLNRMARRAWPTAGPIRLRCEGYRNRRDDDLVELAREVAAQVARTGKPQRLQEMNPYERRLVHIAVREFPGVVSRSEGDGFLKRIRLEKADPR